MAIRMGIVGLGTFGINHLRALSQLQRQGHVVLAGACDVNEKLLEERLKSFEFHPYTQLRDMLDRENLDALTVVTPDPLHRHIAIEALSRGIHCLVEKPLDVTVQGCLEMVNLAQTKGCLLQVDFHKRYDPYHLELKREVESGHIGEVEYGYVHMEDRIEVPRDWFPGWAGKSSPAWFLGVHFYDLVRWILGKDATKVYANGSRKRLRSIGLEAQDSIQAQVSFGPDCHVTFDTSWILPDAFEAVVNQGIRLVGTEGIIEVDSQDRGARGCVKDQGMKTYNLGFLLQKTDKQGREIWQGYGIESIADFAENVAFLRAGGQLKDLQGTYPSGQDGAEVTRIAVAVHESLDKGEPVVIER